MELATPRRATHQKPPRRRRWTPADSMGMPRQVPLAPASRERRPIGTQCLQTRSVQSSQDARPPRRRLRHPSKLPRGASLGIEAFAFACRQTIPRSTRNAQTATGAATGREATPPRSCASLAPATGRWPGLRQPPLRTLTPAQVQLCPFQRPRGPPPLWPSDTLRGSRIRDWAPSPSAETPRTRPP